MSEPLTPRAATDPPDWAVGQAMSELVNGDVVAIEKRARQLLRDFEAERHDEDDDPDQGGEG